MKGHKTKTILERRRAAHVRSEGTTLPGSRNPHKTYGGTGHRPKANVQADSRRATSS